MYRVLPCVGPVRCLLLGSLMVKTDTRVHQQSVFRQIPQRRGQELCHAWRAPWVGGLCVLYVSCSELGRIWWRWKFPF